MGGGWRAVDAASEPLCPPDGRHAPPAAVEFGFPIQQHQGGIHMLRRILLVTVSVTAVIALVSSAALASSVHLKGGRNAEPTFTVNGIQAIPQSEIKNGNTPFSVVTDPPVTPIPGAPECPNPNWTEDITDLAFTTATITVEQPPGTLVLTVTCQFGSPT